MQFMSGMCLGLLNHIGGDAGPHLVHTNAKHAQNGFTKVVLVAVSCQIPKKHFFAQFRSYHPSLQYL